jgi:regulator of RNase E activity RraB
MLDEAEIQENMTGHAERNAALIEDLRRKGVDLGATRSVEHHFWANDQQGAALLAQELYKRKYLVLAISPVDAEDGSKLWNVEAAMKRTLADAAKPKLTEELVRLAARFDATYDGWGASI